jgi:hypothetical protein
MRPKETNVEETKPKQSFPETLARRLRERAAREWRGGNESNELHDLLREAAEWIEAYSEWSEVTERLLKQVATPPPRR